jgi:serine/threonine-protein phosphatase 2A regulatory subunit B
MSLSESSSFYDESLDDELRGPSSSEGFLDGSRRGKQGKLLAPSLTTPSREHPVHYAFAQAFGEKGADGTVVAPVQEADMISAVRFADTADMVATGDKGGRIVILKRVRSNNARDDSSHPFSNNKLNGHLHGEDREDEEVFEYDDSTSETRAPDNLPRQIPAPNFEFWTQFQSHDGEFDYLKSMEIEEKINQIRWCRRMNGGHRLIATNDKTIKIWRIYEKEVTAVASLAIPHSPTSPSSPGDSRRSAVSDSALRSIVQRCGKSPRGAAALSVPKVERRGCVIRASPRRVFSNAHAYHINSISLNSDEETFLSADDLRVNMWNLNVGGGGFNILDMKPENMEDLAEVITAAEFHPRHCHLFMHSSSRGIVKLCDLRQSALCQTWVKQFEAQEDVSARNGFFSEIIASISDAKFSPDGRYILTRDYMNLRLWDVNMERAPILVIPVHDHLRSRLCDLYENDCIFDKFQCSFSHDGGSLLTGSYNSLFQSYSATDGDGAAVEASVDYVSGLSGRHHFSPEGLSANLIAGATASELVDPSRRILHLDASSISSVAAVAAGPALYLYFGNEQAARET